LSRYKMNVFHWHLTDDQGWRIEIRKYPKLTTVGAWRTESDGSRYGGFYTRKQIREVVEYARLRGVTVVPEIEMPGHSSAALAAYPELGCTGQPITVPATWGVFSDIYCAGNERTFTFLQNVLSEVIALFPSPYVHIGGDEVPKERWKQCARCQDVMRREGLTDETQLQSWFVRRIGSWLAEHHRKLIGWDEVLQGGLMEGATVQAWEDTAFTRSAVQAGHDVIASPQGWTYFNRSPGDLTINTVLGFDPVPASLDSVAARHVLGGEAPLWSEHIVSATNLELMAFPRMLGLAERLWTGRFDPSSFESRLMFDHVARLTAMGVAVGPADKDIARIRLEYDTVAQAARVRTEFGMRDVVVRGTTSGRAPAATSPIVKDSSLLTGVGVHRLQSFYRGEAVLGDREVTVVRNNALGKPVQLSAPPRGQYQGTGPGSLTDGLAGSTDHADGLWQGWLGRDIEVVVDLGSIQRVDSVRANFLGNIRSWIMMPPRVEFALSDDGMTWRSIGSVESGIPADREGAIIHAFSVRPGGGTRARYVRVIGRYAGALPAWHPGAGRPSWLFADEIIVR
jgi:hexosaminidase